ncbi:MAG: hypothetical protein RL708_1884 [Bacteroidota bacterium]
MCGDTNHGGKIVMIRFMKKIFIIISLIILVGCSGYQNIFIAHKIKLINENDTIDSLENKIIYLKKRIRFLEIENMNLQDNLFDIRLRYVPLKGDSAKVDYGW